MHNLLTNLTDTMMKLALAAALAGSAAAFTATPMAKTSTAMNAFTVDNMPGALAPMGFFDPLGFAAKADEKTLKRYREAEITHGRVAMLAVIGFLVGEAVEGSSFLFDAQISGPAITHFLQVPDGWDALIITFIGAAEAQRAASTNAQGRDGRAGLKARGGCHHEVTTGDVEGAPAVGKGAVDQVQVTH